MGVTREQAAQNREDILATAERLFRQRGVDGVGLAELMSESGFTRGGFYNHFASKEALVAEVVARAMDVGQQQLEEAIGRSRTTGVDPLVRQVEWYLSEAQRDDIECGCPMAGFAAEAPRLPEQAQGPYAEAVERTFEQMMEMFRERDKGMTRKDARARAVSLFSHMVGTVMLSRAVSGGRPELAKEILDRGRASMLAEIIGPQVASERTRKRRVKSKT